MALGVGTVIQAHQQSGELGWVDWYFSHLTTSFLFAGTTASCPPCGIAFLAGGEGLHVLVPGGLRFLLCSLSTLSRCPEAPPPSS